MQPNIEHYAQYANKYYELATQGRQCYETKYNIREKIGPCGHAFNCHCMILHNSNAHLEHIKENFQAWYTCPQ